MSNSESSILIEFNLDSDSSGDFVFICEIDSDIVEELYGESKNSFDSGDIVPITVHKSKNVNIINAVPTDGSLSFIGNTNKVIEEDILFSSNIEEEPSEYISSVVPVSSSYLFLGRNGNYITSKNNLGQLVITSDISSVPFILNIKNVISSEVYYLYLPRISESFLKERDYPVAVVFYLNVTEVNV